MFIYIAIISLFSQVLFQFTAHLFIFQFVTILWHFIADEVNENSWNCAPRRNHY